MPVLALPRSLSALFANGKTTFPASDAATPISLFSCSPNATSPLPKAKHKPPSISSSRKLLVRHLNQ